MDHSPSESRDDRSAAQPSESSSATGAVVGEDGLARPPWAATDPLLRDYYDTEWGMPVRDEQGLFERISLEAFQAGLSWATILRKRPAFREAFHGFRPDTVAAYTADDVERLMADRRIVRNERKIRAAVANARATLALREEGGLVGFVWSFRPASTPAPRTVEEIPTRSPESTALSKALRRKGFAFVGPTTMFALMEAVGIIDTHLVGSHRRGTSGVWPAPASGGSERDRG
ncbi:DNA-3-methyladenine glycosylase I [Spinactinospora alkalitolerans]|uniref:DNA-3-methyladenine glycosylase I n=1 Tax=Spinactinospora alkalitolerans TaxID=687207 RepID=A0A852TZD2_9ACTN|nr:DNA-3-methyladenine glycosylase I [Spinactinospora alkalitolerans]NYE48667.1 DNA-3-methyladenine glycosylase I [Spinactinospora alkalitolerans]